jgi:hypothetical protein
MNDDYEFNGVDWSEERAAPSLGPTPLWAIGPSVSKRGEPGEALSSAITHYDHDDEVLHRADVERVGGIGEPNAGEFLITTPCGYTGWVRQLNRNYEGVRSCEACLNGRPSPWVKVEFSSGAAHETDDSVRGNAA